MRVGLFGGSFNPVHSGHLHVARTALRRLGLDAVVWLVSPQNPLKSPTQTAAYETRLAMVRALAHGPGMIVSDIEARLGLRYSIDTIRVMKARWPGARFVWVMGGDSLGGLHRWRGWTDLVHELPVAVVSRPGAGVRALGSVAARRLAGARVSPGALAASDPPAWCWIGAPFDPASSTAIRARGGVLRDAAARLVRMTDI